MRILLAIDHSKHSQYTADYLSQMAFAEPVDLELVTVISPMPLASPEFAGLPPIVAEVLEEDERYAREKLAVLSTHLTDQFRSISSTITVGLPGREINQLAVTKDCELIVLGAVGHSTLKRVLLGSVSDYVATQAPSSTLVVRPVKHQDASPTQASSKTRVLVALQNSDRDQRLLGLMRRVTRPSDTEVHLVHVMQMMTFYRQDFRQRASDVWQQSRSDSQSQASELEQLLRGDGFTTASAVLEASHVGEALVDYGEEHHCDLVIAGDRDQNLVDRVFLGSTSRYLLHHADASVLIARESASDN